MPVQLWLPLEPDDEARQTRVSRPRGLVMVVSSVRNGVWGRLPDEQPVACIRPALLNAEAACEACDTRHYGACSRPWRRRQEEQRS